MIKPATLWAICKTCPDSKWIGDICRALGGQQVDLDFGQEQMLSSIKTDSGWMDERIEFERERHRKNMAAYRDRKRKSVTDVTVTDHRDDHVNPSVPPSVPTTRINNSSVCESNGARSLALPDLKSLIQIAVGEMGVTAEYAAWWYGEMKSRGWQKTNGDKIDGSNWRPLLKAWFIRATPAELQVIEQAKAKAPKKVTVRPQDWLLCAERCANLVDGKCACGIRIPPQINPQHNHAPNECPSFTAIN